MNFNEHYFNEENLTEINWLKSRFLSNALRALAGSGKRKVNPQDFKRFIQLTPAGYSEMFAALSNRYEKTGGTKISSLKNYIKDAFSAIFNPQKDGQNVFPYKDQEGNQKFVEFTKDPKTQVKASSFYVTNKGGRLMLVYLEDDEGNDKYYIGLDGNAEKFFVAPVKKGGMGKDFKTWLAAQAASTYKPDQKTISPEFLGKGEGKKEEPKTAKEKGLMPFQYEIPKDQYKKLIPKTGAKFAIAASYNYPSILDLFSEDVLGEKALEVDGKKAVTIGPRGEWYRLTSKNKMLYNTPISSFKNVIAVNKKGEPEEDLQAELDKEIEIQTKNKEPEDTENKEQKPTEEDEKGKLYVELQDELDPKTPPSKVKPSEKTKNGWRFMLKNGGIIFIYQTTDDRNMIGFDDKAKKVVNSKDLINKYKLEVSTENPEVESPE